MNLILSSFDFTDQDNLLPNASILCILRLLGDQELGTTKEREVGAPREGPKGGDEDTSLVSVGEATKLWESSFQSD